MLIKHCLKYLFKSNKFLFFSINIMILITSFMAFTLLITNNNLETVNENNQALKQEDFQFLPKLSKNDINIFASQHQISLEEIEEKNFNQILFDHQISYRDIYGDKISGLQKNYGFISEIQQSKFFEVNGNNFRVVKNNEKINKFFFVKGEMAVEDNEIVIDINTAKKKDLNIGSSFIIKEKEYIVSGIASFPGLINPNMSDTGLKIYKPATSVIVSFNDKQYNALNEKEKIYYAGVWTSQKPQEIPSAEVEYLLEKNDNTEINILDLKISMNKMIIGVTVTLLLSIVGIMLAMVLIKMIQDNLKTYGVLKGMGYKNYELIFSFSPTALLLILPVSLGILLSSLMNNTIFGVMNNDLLAPYPNKSMDMFFSVSVVSIFTIGVLAFSFLIIFLFLRKNSINLIRETSQAKNNLIKRVLLKLFARKKFLSNLRNKFIFRNLFVFCLVIFSGFALGVQILMSMGMSGFPDQMANSFEKQYKYEYKSILNDKVNITDVKDAQGYFVRNLKIDSKNNNSDDISLIALDSNEKNQYIHFYDYETNKNITDQLSNGVIINKWFANKHNLKVGDKLTVYDNQKNNDVTIAGINLDLQGNELYTSQTYYEDNFLEKVNFYSGFYSKDMPIMDKGEIRQTIVQKEQYEAIKLNFENYKIISGAMLLLGMILGGILLSISIYIAIKTGEKNILLLKSMGYTNSEINKVSIIGYVYPLLIGIAISIPYFILLSKLLFGELSKSANFFLPMQTSLVNILTVTGISLLFFALVAIVYMMKIKKSTSFQKLLAEQL